MENKILNSRSLPTEAPPRRNHNEKSNSIISKDRSSDLELLSISKTAKIMRIGKSRVYDLINSNQLRVINFNGTIRIPYFEIRDCLENLCSNSSGLSLAANKVKSSNLVVKPSEIMKNIQRKRYVQ